MNEIWLAETAAKLGYSQGATFAYTPFDRLTKADDVIVGLNPGGEDLENKIIWEVAENDYFSACEGKTPYQRMKNEVQAWHHFLGIDPFRVFIAQYIPFRTRVERELIDSKRTRMAVDELWKSVIAKTAAKRIICMGNTAATAVGQICGVGPWAVHSASYGRATVGRAIGHICNENGARNVVVARLPHPSRHKLLSSNPAAETLKARQDAITWATRPINRYVREA